MSEVEAFPLRGTWTGNRGILHSAHEIVRCHAHDSWLICELQFKGRRRRQWQPGECTFLHFHDEAVALAAGHRPWALCRRGSYEDFRAKLGEGLGIEAPRARDLDRLLHGERLHRGTHRRRLHELPWPSLPRGTFVDLDGIPPSSSMSGWSRRRPRATARAGPVPSAAPPP